MDGNWRRSRQWQQRPRAQELLADADRDTPEAWESYAAWLRSKAGQQDSASSERMRQRRWDKSVQDYERYYVTRFRAVAVSLKEAGTVKTQAEELHQFTNGLCEPLRLEAEKASPPAEFLE